MTDIPTSDGEDLASIPPPSPLPTPQQGDLPYLPLSRWSYWYPFGAVAVGVVAVAVAVAVIGGVAGRDAVEDLNPLVLLGIQSFASLGALVAFSWFRGSRSWKQDYGFELSWRQWWGFPAGMVLQIGVALATYPLVQLISDDDAPQQAIARVAASISGADLAFFTFVVVVLAPVIEEVTFRGMLLGRLMKTMTKHPAVLISSAAFALTHLLDPNAILVVPGLFLVGIGLGYLALRGGNLGLAVLAHAGVNGLAVLLLVYQDDIAELQESAGALGSLLLQW